MCAIWTHIWVKYERVSCEVFVWCILVSIRGVYICGVYVGVSVGYVCGDVVCEVSVWCDYGVLVTF